MATRNLDFNQDADDDPDAAKIRLKTQYTKECPIRVSDPKPYSLHCLTCLLSFDRCKCFVVQISFVIIKWLLIGWH